MTRHSATLMRRFTTCFMAAAATVESAIALAPEAAGDHETVGTGTFQVYNSDSPCTDFRNSVRWYTACPGDYINLPPGGSYIVVPLGTHSWVACETYAPDGLLFEHAVENRADVPRKQLFWAEKGWGRPLRAGSLVPTLVIAAARIVIRTTFAATCVAAVILGATSPAAAATPTPTPPPGATAQCCDGSPSYSQHRSGTCSHHGGVCQWCPCGSATGQINFMTTATRVIDARRRGMLF